MMFQFKPSGLLHRKGKQHAQNMDNHTSDERFVYTQEQYFNSHSLWCLLDAEHETITLDSNNQIFLCVWPNQDAALRFAALTPDEVSIPYEIKEKELADQIQVISADSAHMFAVYPTERDFWACTPQDLHCALFEKDWELYPNTKEKIDE